MVGTDETSRRVDRFQETLDPRALWPGVDERGFRVALEEVVRVTSGVLTAAEGIRSEVDEEPARNMEAFGAAAFASGMGPLLGYWLETGRLGAPPPVAALLATHLDHGRRRAARLRGELETLARLFRQAGIEVTVLKGLHTGWAYFPEPGTRPASDIDLLVSADAVPDAERVLLAAGFAPRYRVRERSTWVPRASLPPVSLMFSHVDNPWEVDLHQTLDRRIAGAASPVTFGTLRDADRDRWQVGGDRVWTLAQPLHACFLCVHAANHLPQLPPLRLVELVLMLRRDLNRSLGWQGLAQELGRTRTEMYGFASLKLVEDLVPGTVDPGLLDALRRATPRRVRRFASTLTPVSALQVFHRTFEGRFLWASGWQRLVAVAAWAWPDDGHGRRVPVREVVRITRTRLRRLLGGRYRRRVR